MDKGLLALLPDFMSNSSQVSHHAVFYKCAHAAKHCQPSADCTLLYLKRDITNPFRIPYGPIFHVPNMIADPAHSEQRLGLFFCCLIDLLLVQGIGPTPLSIMAAT